MCVCVCVCVRERERERESKKERDVVQAMRDAASGCSGRKLGRQREA